MKFSGNNRPSDGVEQNLQTSESLTKCTAKYTKTCYHMGAKSVDSLRFEDLIIFAKISLKIGLCLFYF